MGQQVERPTGARGRDAHTHTHIRMIIVLLTTTYLCFLFCHKVNVVQATHQQHELVAPRRRATRSGTANAT